MSWRQCEECCRGSDVFSPLNVKASCDILSTCTVCYGESVSVNADAASESIFTHKICIFSIVNTSTCVKYHTTMTTLVWCWKCLWCEWVLICIYSTLNIYTLFVCICFGFRKGISTVDAVFILQSIIQKYVNMNKRLYCFIDMEHCCDSIYSNALWIKLFKYNLDGKMLRIIRSMYQSVKSCVRHCNTYSDYFILLLA